MEPPPLPAAARPATIRDVAKHAGVSLMTVSRALNDKQAARPQTRERIKRAIKALDYTPNSAAKSLASGTASNLEKR